MGKTVFIILICLAFTLPVKALNKLYTDSDFYGTWNLHHYELEDDIYIFKKEKSSKNQEEKLNITITLLELGKCNANYDKTTIFCGIGTYRDYSWSFNKDLGIINIYHSKEWLKEFKEQSPEDFKDFGLPEKYNSMELKIVTLQSGEIGLEILDWE